MKRWKLIFGVILVFVLGMLAGSLGTGLLYKYRIIKPWKMEPSNRRAMILEKYTDTLDLTPDQQGEFEKIIQEMDDHRRAYFKQIRPEMNRIREQGFLKMKQHLSPSQQVELDRLHEKFRKRYNNRR